MRNDFENDRDYRSWSSLVEVWEREDRNQLRRVATVERVTAITRESGASDQQRRLASSRRGRELSRATIAAKRARA